MIYDVIHFPDIEILKNRTIEEYISLTLLKIGIITLRCFPSATEMVFAGRHSFHWKELFAAGNCLGKTGSRAREGAQHIQCNAIPLPLTDVGHKRC